MIPLFVKKPIADRIQKIAERTRAKLYFPSHPGEKTYCVSAPRGDRKRGEFSMPPESLWAGYGPDAETYLGNGKRDVEAMARILADAGFPVSKARRILEFGCSAGRMIRHVPAIAPDAEVWGVDISAEHISWCMKHLTPEIHFATTTVVPHLPFEDCSMDLIFCGSVFTHIEDIQETWLLELARLLRPGGVCYLSIHDENTIQLLDSPKYRGCYLDSFTRSESVYLKNKDNFGMMVMGRGPDSQVFYTSAYFRSICPPSFRWVSLTPGAYGFQTAVLLEKLQRE